MFAAPPEKLSEVMRGLGGLLSMWMFINLLGAALDLAKKMAKTLTSPPGLRLPDLVETVFSRKTYATVFEPILRDLYVEYREALDKGRPSKARWVCIRGYWSFWSAVFAQMPVSAFKLVSQIWKAIP